MSTPTLRILRAAAVLAAVTLAGACGDDGPSAPPPPPTPGNLTGTVRTAEGTAVPGAVVSLQQGTATVRTTSTDSAGAFRADALQPGSYSLNATLPAGFQPASLRQDVRVNAGATTDVALAAQAVRAHTDTVAPGRTDTVTLASGMSASVAVPAGGAPVVVAVAQAAVPAFGVFDALAAPVSLELRALAGAARGAGARAEVAAPVVTVWQRVPTCTGATAEFAFEAGTSAEGKPLFLFGDPTCTTWTDPRTGQSGAAYNRTAPLPVGSRLNLVLFATSSTCDGGERSLTALGGGAEDPSKVPVILIHGLQPFKTSCRSFRDWDAAAATFPELTNALRGNDSTARAYQLYALRYPTFEPVANAVAYLRGEVMRRGWQNRDIVLVGHSMGGLVGRGYVAAHGAEHVRALVTLGTPHLGSPFANEAAVAGAIGRCVNPVLGLGTRLLPRSAGVRDLDPAGDWIGALGGQRGGADRIYTFAGDGRLVPDLPLVGCVMDRVIGAAGHDGAVTVASALPDWTTFQTLVRGADHLGINAQAAPPVTRLLAQLSQCLPGTPPAAPAANGFPLSGTLSRQPGGRIDVVLNPVVVDGTPARGLTKANFAVVENHCLKPFEITTSEGNLGVDLVFIQDLSGSMSGAITGVRNSVLQFAATLRDRGLNVRIGSVGFSGPGTITTHANQGVCERVGPVQDLASPETFRSHVAGSWFATGGCDSPENALEAIEHAHRNLTWRGGATRVYVLVTDVSVHTAADRCNGLGPCTDQTLASIVELVGSTGTIHVVAPSSASQRTVDGALDPWLLAERTGGARLVLPTSGVVDLNALGVADRLADIVRLSFASGSGEQAHHRIRVRVEYGGKVSELSPGLVVYDADRALVRAPRR
ncbi:MAG TPA: alpha/beta fold hydrolase [Longimicrobium sp.]